MHGLELEPTYLLSGKVCWLFEFNILTTSKVISGHLYWLYDAVPLRHQATGTITEYPTQSHYPGTELTSPCPLLIIPCIWIESDVYIFRSLVGFDHDSKPWVWIPWATKTGERDTQHIRRSVWWGECTGPHSHLPHWQLSDKLVSLGIIKWYMHKHFNIYIYINLGIYTCVYICGLKSIMQV